jgi:DNA repair ATPase RecN
MHTDSSTDSEFEVDLSDLSTSSEDDVRSLSKNAKNAKEFLNNLIDREMQKHDVKSQIDGTIEHLTKSMDKLLPEIKNIDKEFDQMEKMVDEMRENLYRPFRPVPTFLEPLDLDDSESQSDDNIVQLSQPSAESPRGGTVAKRVTQLPQSANRAQQHKVFMTFLKK